MFTTFINRINLGNATKSDPIFHHVTANETRSRIKIQIEIRQYRLSCLIGQNQPGDHVLPAPSPIMTTTAVAPTHCSDIGSGLCRSHTVGLRCWENEGLDVGRVMRERRAQLNMWERAQVGF